MAASLLARAGRRNVINLVGGFAAWQGAGLPVVTPVGPVS
jgi:rhodanese-related sulfurtransferase